jgi:hypothetical protein
MENQKNNMGLVETILLDMLFMGIFVLTLFLAVSNPAPRNLFAIDMPLIFGGLTFPFAKTLGKWLVYLRFHENQKIAAKLNLDPDMHRWLFYDFGVPGYTLMFRVLSIVIAGASIYHLIVYLVG